MRIVSVIVKDENDMDVVIILSLNKKNVRNMDGLRKLIQNAVADYYGDTKIKNKKMNLGWKDLAVIPWYITEPNGFKVLRMYSGNNVFFGNSSNIF